MIKAVFYVEIDLPTGEVYTFSSAGVASQLGSTGLIGQAVFKPSTFEVSRNLEDKYVSIEIPVQSDFNLTLIQGLFSDAVQSDTFIKYSYILEGVERVLMYGTLDSAVYTDISIKIKMASFINNLGKGKNFQLSETCSKKFRSAFCGFSPTALSISDTIGTITPDRLSVTLTTATGVPFNLYQDGVIEFTPLGSLPGERPIILDIALSDDNRLFLWEQVPQFIVAGASVTVFEGCSKTEARCRELNNFVNFSGIPSGFNFAPTQNDFLQGASS